MERLYTSSKLDNKRLFHITGEKQYEQKNGILEQLTYIMI